MNTLWTKIFVIVIIFIAETASIYGEILAAKYFVPNDASFWKIFWKLFIFILFFSVMILIGYMLGIKTFKNIWVVSVISITSILIAEPILAYSIFKQMPTNGALIGLIFGALGFLATIFLK